MAKKVINAYTELDLTLPENQNKLEDIENGELVVQSSSSDELKIWGKTSDGTVTSLPTTEDVTDIVDAKVSDIKLTIDMAGYAKIDQLNTVNGQSLYTEKGTPVDIVISGGTLTDEQVKNLATKEELNSKANVSDVYTKDSVYTKNEVDAYLAAKADSATTFTKDEVNGLVNAKANVADVYTKDEIDDKISGIQKFTVEVVDELPAIEDASEEVIYLVKAGENEVGVLYTEYILSNGVWENLGQQTLDLAQYSTTEEMNAAINAAVEGFYTEAQVDGLLAKKAEVSDVVSLTTDLNNYKTEVSTALSQKADASALEGLATETFVNQKIAEAQLGGSGGTVVGLSGYTPITAFTELSNTVSGKADASALTALNDTVSGKADASALTALSDTVSGKADASALTALSDTVSGKADASALTALNETVSGKADASALTALNDTVSGKADIQYVNDEIKKNIAATGAYAIVVLPETYKERIEAGETVEYNGVEYTYNENTIYFYTEETVEEEA